MHIDTNEVFTEAKPSHHIPARFVVGSFPLTE